MEIIFTLDEIGEVANTLLEKAEHKKCFAFFASMGAGKTTLIKALCKELEVTDNVASPTYSIINEYKRITGEQVVHMDWYRLKDEEDALNAGVADYMASKNYCFIEWPERAIDLLPTDYLRLEIEVLDENRRKCIFRI